MGLLKSPAGTSVALPFDEWMAREVDHYAVVLTDEWKRDPKKVAWVAAQWPTDRPDDRLEHLALLMWSDMSDLLIVGLPLSIWRGGRANHTACCALREMNYADWEAAAERIKPRI